MKYHKAMTFVAMATIGFGAVAAINSEAQAATYKPGKPNATQVCLKNRFGAVLTGSGTPAATCFKSPRYKVATRG